jgi:hypothetical protein
MIYRKFSVRCEAAIIERATDEGGKLHCERCAAWMRRRADFEIDHVIAEAIRPEADKKRPLVPADGQLLCKARCHKAKTANDIDAAARAERRKARSLGVKVKHRRRKREKGPYRPPPGRPEIARRFQ